MRNGEIVKSVFEEMTLNTVVHDGELMWMASEVGEALGYEDVKSFSKHITSGDWKQDFEEGEDYYTVSGPKLSKIKKLLKLEAGFASSRAKSITFLTESGVYGAAVLSRKPLGVKLRKHIRQQILPQVRRGIAKLISEDEFKRVKQDERERRLMLQAETAKQRVEMAERQMKAGSIRKLTSRLQDLDMLKPDVAAAYEVTATEIETRLDMSHLRPNLPGGIWKSPTQISEETGFTPQKIGHVATVTKVKGDDRYSKATLWVDPKNGIGRPCYMYNEKGVDIIMKAINGNHAPLV